MRGMPQDNVGVSESDEPGSGRVNICKLEPIAAESTVPGRVKKYCCSDANESDRKTGERSSFFFPSLAVFSCCPPLAKPKRGPTLREKCDLQGPSPR